MSEFESQDRRATMVLESSVVFRAVDRVLEQVWGSASHSSGAEVSRQVGARWAGLPMSSRWFSIGLMLLVAAVTHLLLTIITETPWGWQWLILPALGAAAGVLLVLASLEAPKKP